MRALCETTRTAGITLTVRLIVLLVFAALFGWLRQHDTKRRSSPSRESTVIASAVGHNIPRGRCKAQDGRLASGVRKRMEKPFINKSLAHSFAVSRTLQERLAVISCGRHDAQRTALFIIASRPLISILNHLFHSSQINQGEETFGKIDLNLMFVTRRLRTH